ncbi:MAG: histidine phosphatase family protein [Pseudomonadota bacterium]
MSELVLVRHGQASFGTDDYDRLSPVGFQQARWLGDYFHRHSMRFDRAFRGNLRRHRETADSIAETFPVPAYVEDARFNEFESDILITEYIRETGADSPRDRATFLHHFPEVLEGWERGTLNGSESYTAFRARVGAAMADVLQEGGRNLVVTSGGVICVTLAGVLGLSARGLADLLMNVHNASVHVLRMEEGRLRLELFNATPHIDGKERSHARTYI